MHKGTPLLVVCVKKPLYSEHIPVESGKGRDVGMMEEIEVADVSLNNNLNSVSNKRGMEDNVLGAGQCLAAWSFPASFPNLLLRKYNLHHSLAIRWSLSKQIHMYSAQQYTRLNEEREMSVCCRKKKANG